MNLDEAEYIPLIISVIYLPSRETKKLPPKASTQNCPKGDRVYKLGPQPLITKGAAASPELNP